LNIIHILDESISNKIAAGEVVERPASVVKELVENSIDANSTSITVEIRDGGISYIKVYDNGIGMNIEDAKIAFIRHATSKISDEKDLNNINTLGFRGEALASIASISEVELLTKIKDDIYGTKIYIEGGINKFIDSTGCPDGTTIIVKNLFYNTPARLKFLKNQSREGAIISDVLLRLALSKPDISFKFINNGKLVFNTPGDGDLKNTILTLYGKELFGSLIKVSYTGNILSISGYIGKPEASRSNRNFQTFFINNRYIKSKMLSTAVDNAYKTLLPINKFAFCILNISIYPELVDVNVHPTKAEVRFQDDREVFSALFNTVRNGLLGEVIIPDIKDEKEVIQTEQQLFNFKAETTSIPQVTDISYNIQDYKNQYKKDSYIMESSEKEKPYRAINGIEVDSNITYERNEAKNLLPPLVIIGQSHYTYILAQGPDGLYVIDQHAAHERIMFEKFSKSFESGGVQLQTLVVPFVLELTPEELAAVKDNLDVISKLGFDVDFFGNNSIILRSVPIIFGEPQLKKLFLETIDSMVDNVTTSKGTIDKMLNTMACKSAVKANDKLSLIEMEELINLLRQTLNPYTCPHGRPTIIKLTKNELEKKFKRIQ
jgi:DNA mismatch repair protein MutL